ncbi:MAG: SpoIIE family protein phosphatase [Magnetococcales bacterium]|nr:SpoIIE family protein phosphatase [Magnetococcales bacterium]
MEKNRKNRILIVDDERFNIQVLVELLKTDYKLIAAKNGRQAIKAARSDPPPDLILLDIMMPEMDGYEVCRLLKEEPHTQDIPVIFITGMTNVEDETKGLELGAIDYITKPISPSVVLARVRTHLALRAAHQKLAILNDHLLMEREFIESIIEKMRGSERFDDHALRYLLAPVEKTMGDMLFSRITPDGGQYVMLGDFTGHGLTAAIGGPIVSDIFYTMTDKGLPMSEIMEQMNQQLHEKMPTGMFLAACFLALDSTRTTLTVWNCNVPDVLVFRGTEIRHRVESAFLPRGVILRSERPGEVVQVARGDRLFVTTDGLIETRDPEGRIFGQEAMESLLSRLIEKGEPLENIHQDLALFRNDHEQEDDLTMVEITC